jgi:hypothetical protein
MNEQADADDDVLDVAPDRVDVSVVPSGEGCSDCDAAQPPGWWFHLRRCAACGHVGCCDSSPGQHARGHFRTTGHSIIQSFEPGEDWYFDFSSNQMLSGPRLAGPSAHPADQPAPGPVGRVPANWKSLLHR